MNTTQNDPCPPVYAYTYYSNSIYLNLTNRCTNHCCFCARYYTDFHLAQHNLRLHQEPDYEAVVSQIESLMSVNGKPNELIFCGFGEPTLRFELLLRLARAYHAKAIRTRLNTNGQVKLINGKNALQELSPCIDAISISMNAPDEHSYLELCRPSLGAIAYYSLLDCIHEAPRFISEVTLSVVGTVLTHHQIEQCRLFAQQQRVRFRIR